VKEDPRLRRKEASDATDQGPLVAETRRRMTRDITLFLVAIDACMTNGSRDNLQRAHDAAERLLLSAARTRVEVAQLTPAQPRVPE
jgi:Mg-chelatase subunit ChlD